MLITYGGLYYYPDGNSNYATVGRFCKTYQVYYTQPKQRYFFHLISEECRLCNSIRVVSYIEP